MSITASTPESRSLAAGDRNAAAAAGDRDRPGFDEPTDRFQLHDLERLGRRDDAAMAAVCIRDHRPAALALEQLGLLGRIERADRFRRAVEGGIVGRNGHVRQEARDLAVVERRAQLRGDECADLRLGLRNRQPQRQRWSLGCGALLPQQLVADLRAVPVRDHETLALREQGTQRGDRAAQIRQLLGRGAALAGPHERVPAKGDDRAHTSAVSSSPFSASTSFNVGSPIS